MKNVLGHVEHLWGKMFKCFLFLEKFPLKFAAKRCLITCGLSELTGSRNSYHSLSTSGFSLPCARPGGPAVVEQWQIVCHINYMDMAFPLKCITPNSILQLQGTV